MGILDKLRGKKEEIRVEEVERSFRPEPIEEPNEEVVGQRWLEAKRWREQKAMEEPLIKRADFKRKY